MSDLITPNLNGMSERQFKRKGQLNVTHDELGEQLQEMAQAILEAFGPIGAMQVELMARQQALEDHLQYVYVPKTAETLPFANPSESAVSTEKHGEVSAPTERPVTVSRSWWQRWFR